MERARREDDAIRLHRALRLKKIDICPGVPYVYVRSTDVWNGLVYLILSSATRLDAVWRALRPFKEGEILLLRPLMGDISVDSVEPLSSLCRVSVG